MTAVPVPVLLDTNILVHLARGGTAAERIETRFALRSRRTPPMLSVISVGEILAMAKRNGWGGPKLQRLVDAMENLVIVDLNREPILQSYAAIDAHLAGSGTPIGQQNDLWIAATGRGDRRGSADDGPRLRQASSIAPPARVDRSRDPALIRRRAARCRHPPSRIPWLR